MADKKPQEKKSAGLQIKFLRKLTPAPEKRNEPSKGAYPAGRFKMCFDIIKSNFSNLAIVNILTLLFALPMLAAVGFVAVLGFERFSYLLHGITETPYLMSNLGIGLSQGASIAVAKADMLIAYRVLFSAIAVSLPILGFGLAGIYHVVTKMVWGESFICKKDKYGNDIPRMVIEYFRGVKLYWKQTVVIMSVFAVVFAGASNLIIGFVQGLWLNNLNAGHWFGLILSCLVGFVSILVLFNLLPMVVAYELPLVTKLKNAFLLSAAFLVPTMFIISIASIPFILLVGGPLLKMLAALALSMIGFSFFCLISANYLGYNSEKIIVPLYETVLLNERKKNSKKKNKKGNSNKKQ
ncbi:MAG: hypothetical protein PHI19_05840 [Clostridia bacterium]|nr:hypothetical protein [Clostridia bacterium]